MRMIAKILIANRGEIALRIIQACQEMGIVSVAVYSDADQDALHTRFADEAVHIGPALSRKSYLDIERIMAAARQNDVDAIHPGYGFLSENATFAQACETEGIAFIGPSSDCLPGPATKPAFGGSLLIPARPLSRAARQHLLMPNRPAR